MTLGALVVFSLISLLWASLLRSGWRALRWMYRRVRRELTERWGP